MTSLELPPPSLVNRNEYYDKLPVSHNVVTIKLATHFYIILYCPCHIYTLYNYLDFQAPSIALPVLGHYDDTISLDTVSIASFGDDEDEGSEEWSDVVTSYSPLGEKEGG